MNDNHVEEFEDLFAAYAMFGFVPVNGWATADLVTLSKLIDVELQQRAAENEQITGY
jgi:hypothetical protein